MKKVVLLIMMFFVTHTSLQIFANSWKAGWQVSNGMEVVYHQFRLPESKSESDIKLLYQALYSDINIFHVELDSKTKVATVITRPQVTSKQITEALKAKGITSILIKAEKRVEDSYGIEQKALERNRIAKSLK